MFLTAVEYQYSPDGMFPAMPLLVLYIWLGNQQQVIPDFKGNIIFSHFSEHEQFCVCVFEKQNTSCTCSCNGSECMWFTTQFSLFLPNCHNFVWVADPVVDLFGLVNQIYKTIHPVKYFHQKILMFK